MASRREVLSRWFRVTACALRGGARFLGDADEIGRLLRQAGPLEREFFSRYVWPLAAHAERAHNARRRLVLAWREARRR